MKNQILLMTLIGGIGIVIGLLLQRPNSEGPNNITATDQHTPSVVNDLNNSSMQSEDRQAEIYELTALRELVQKEIESRKLLENEIIALNERIEIIENQTPNSEMNTQPPARTTTTISTRNRQDASHSSGWMNEQALINAGLDINEANRIRDIYEEVEMEKLQLRDRAVREGWIGDDRYRTERQQLDARLETLRSELDENAYDAFLFATGRPNRVVVQSTLRTSPARESGVKSGDTVIRYDNMRIYTWADLRQATTQCPTQSMVEVELETKGKRHRVFVPCGPMGARLDNDSVQPLAK